MNEPVPPSPAPSPEAVSASAVSSPVPPGGPSRSAAASAASPPSNTETAAYDPSGPALGTVVSPLASASPSATGFFTGDRRWRWMAGAVAIGLLLALVAAGIAWDSRSRYRALERELVKRQETGQEQMTEARVAARAAQDAARESLARVAVVEARVAETALQRTQLDDLVQSLSRSRAENLLGDIEAGLRSAMQQSAITGSAEPLVLALRQTGERLSSSGEPRLDNVRRAAERDLDRVHAAGMADVATLTLRIDELGRLVDELPLIASAQARGGPSAEPSASASDPAIDSNGNNEGDLPDWLQAARNAWDRALSHLGAEIRSLVRVTRIAEPEAMLIAPEQAYFLRENLKLRLLNARLALLSRQFDAAQADLRRVQEAMARYFDDRSRRVAAALDLSRQISTQLKTVGIPRPDETLAALASAAAGR